MPPDDAMVDYYASQIKAFPANPASMHQVGHDAMKALESAIRTLSGHFGCRPDEITLTSGGTESINLALKGTIEANPRLGRRIVISAAEHAAVVNTARWLSGQGCEVETVPLTRMGTVDLAHLEKALQEPCALVSLIYVNNETGAVNPIEEIVRIRNQLQPTTRIHLDGVQATGKIPWNFADLGVDLFSGSGHKFAAPRGIGWLIHRKGLRIHPLLHGGGQQKNLRSGTENVPLARALVKAVEEAFAGVEKAREHVAGCRHSLLDQLDQLGVSYVLLSPDGAVPHIVNLSVQGLRGETLLHALADRQIMVSTGSACSSKSKSASPVLKAMSIPPETAAGSVRISISSRECPDDMRHTARQIAEIAAWLTKK